ncbi:hypothetical protein A2773_04605 [Candidatus Gottesmanbacteria bacterium RIFCSPHIGHO2_01_FULL_39_10]|uniref:Uncharacterized protein n=1 Tax=Candidatus Gottesmanbacteria bacterium RIFCSPHIGHO2_01_FULL_39_10 TaxID=1798375 RepID=A0A1F5ZRY9_9BACT|nr:MAG: hypothetical protein A2773_04605 [Candidatus Gottesmanbacteria bacterium RIFCSPHIGHO2_01_FULL_39_10]
MSADTNPGGGHAVDHRKEEPELPARWEHLEENEVRLGLDPNRPTPESMMRDDVLTKFEQAS